jgi:hypothetical protein
MWNTNKVRRAIRAEPEYSTDFSVLSDSRKLGDDQYLYDEIHHMATMEGVVNPKIAMVVSTQVSFGVARTWQTLSENDHTEIEIFYYLEEALTWLGQMSEMPP